MVIPPEVLARINECAKHDFVALRDHWFACLKWSTTIVAAGLVLELPELVYELADIARERIDSLKYRIVLLEEWLKTAKVVAFVGWFLIVGGVVGERYAEVRVNDADASIQTCSDAKVMEATLEAGDAATSAKEAQDASATAKKDSAGAVLSASSALIIAKGARNEANSFDTRIVSATNKATEAESHLADALREAAQAQEELNRLKTPRMLSPEQQQRIAAKLKPFLGMQFDVALTNEPEAQDFMLVLENVIGMGGWTEIDWKGEIIVFTRPPPGHVVGMVTVTGIIIQIHKEQVSKLGDAAIALAEALKAEGINAKAEGGVGPKNDNPNAIHVLVGEKPK